jgi:DNA-binding transcriptional MerR regulator
MQHAEQPLTIGALARLTGLSAKVIRYYEAVGLLPQPPRGANGYRRYGNADVNRLALLRRLRLLGVPLREAKVLLTEATSARCVEVQQSLVALIERPLRAIDQELAELHQLRTIVEG